MKKLRNLVAGLSFSLLAGCYQSTLPADSSRPRAADECVDENDTTFPLNVETDGQIAPYNWLEAENPSALLTPELIDVVNESHKLSSGGMPENIFITQVPEHCFEEQDLVCGCDVWMYTHFFDSPYALPGSSRGDIFVPSKLSLKDKIGLDHELGHHQPGGGKEGREVIATLNSVEQFLATFGLFVRNYRENQVDIDRFFKTYYGNGFSLERLVRYNISYIDIGRFEGLNEEIHAEAYPYIFLALTETSGSFDRVRRDTQAAVTEGRLESLIQERLPLFKERFALETYDSLYTEELQQQHRHARQAEAVLQLKMAFITYLAEHFGKDVARAYHRQSAGISQSPGPVLLPGTRNCEIMGGLYVPWPDALADCTPDERYCTRYGAAAHYSTTASFCCIEPDFESRILPFKKYTAEADIQLYIGSYSFEELPDGTISFDSEPLEIDGGQFIGAIPTITIREREEIDISMKCR